MTTFHLSNRIPLQPFSPAESKLPQIVSLDRFEGFENFACRISGTLWEEGGIRRLYQGVLGSSSLDAGCCGFLQRTCLLRLRSGNLP